MSMKKFLEFMAVLPGMLKRENGKSSSKKLPEHVQTTDDLRYVVDCSFIKGITQPGIVVFLDMVKENPEVYKSVATDYVTDMLDAGLVAWDEFHNSLMVVTECGEMYLEMNKRIKRAVAERMSLRVSDHIS